MKRAARTLVVVGSVLILWLGCSRKHDSNSFLPSAPEFVQALVLAVSASAIPADGFSRLEITAQITGGADLDKRQVRFTTDNGDFPREPTAGTKTTAIDVDSTGSATVELRSSTSPTPATITAQVLKVLDDNTLEAIAGLITRITVDFTAADAETILRLSASSLVGEGDGTSTIFIHADVAPELPLSNVVSFVTTLGKFINGTMDSDTTTQVTPDIGRRATAALESPSVAGEALVTATVMSTTKEIRIVYDPALPEVIVVNLDETKLERGGAESAGITLILSRSVGVVSDGLPIQYSAHEKEYGEQLDFLFGDQTLTDSEAATATVSLGAVDFVGTATIRAQMNGVTGEADIEVDAPADESDIKADKGIVTFGDVMVGTDSADETVTITNDAGATGSVIVSNVSLSGQNRSQFSIPAKPAVPVELDPGESFVVEVRFSPTSEGSKSASLRIASNDPDKPVLSIALTGTGTP